MHVGRPHIDAEDGFSLIELMIVLIIIGILMALALPHLNTTKDSARGQVMISTASSYAQAIDLFRKDHNGRIPNRAADWHSDHYKGPIDKISGHQYRRGMIPEGAGSRIYLQTPWDAAPASGIRIIFHPWGDFDYIIEAENFNIENSNSRYRKCYISTLPLSGVVEC